MSSCKGAGGGADGGGGEQAIVGISVAGAANVKRSANGANICAAVLS